MIDKNKIHQRDCRCADLGAMHGRIGELEHKIKVLELALDLSIKANMDACRYTRISINHTCFLEDKCDDCTKKNKVRYIENAQKEIDE